MSDKKAKKDKAKKKFTRRDWFDLILILVCIPILIIGFAVSMSVYRTKQNGGVTTIAGRCFLTVQTKSMEPMLLVGDTFMCKVVSADTITEGDIISYNHGKRIITHKVDSVIKQTKDGETVIYFSTYGINNTNSKGDYVLDNYLVHQDDLLGIYAGSSGLNKFAGFLTSPWGMFTFVIVPLGVLIVTDILSLVSYFGKKKPAPVPAIAADSAASGDNPPDDNTGNSDSTEALGNSDNSESIGNSESTESTGSPDSTENTGNSDSTESTGNSDN